MCCKENTGKGRGQDFVVRLSIEGILTCSAVLSLHRLLDRDELRHPTEVGQRFH